MLEGMKCALKVYSVSKTPKDGLDKTKAQGRECNYEAILIVYAQGQGIQKRDLGEL